MDTIDQLAPLCFVHATLMELAVLMRDDEAAEEQLSEALGFARAGWELESTAANLTRMRRARWERGEDVALIERLEQELVRAAAKDMAPQQKTS